METEFQFVEIERMEKMEMELQFMEMEQRKKQSERRESVCLDFSHPFEDLSFLLPVIGCEMVVLWIRFSVYVLEV
ncbi:hypothetical protein MRB53_025650 [Persea americana]|uniref:Uncharacterized protein n=1 Tax=Persea americana TaxID=3435 RepID=A0ACC2LFX3_PERAE|nr:hypothetical protein MRB53_025650 [Persea americana]